jgi:DNA ligase (NAD+)
MEEAGVNLKGKIEEEGDRTAMTDQDGIFEGKAFVVTGKLEGMTRHEAESLIRRHGGNASSSVTKSTDYLVMGEKPGSKLTKAKQLGTEILDQQQFEALIAGR